MGTKCKRICQIGVLVENLDVAVEKYKKYFGMTDWEYGDLSHLPFPLEVNGEPGKLNIKVASNATNEGLAFELIEPVGEGPFMDYFKEHGPGIHFIAMVTPDKNKFAPEIISSLMEDGYAPLCHAKVPDGVDGPPMEFAYMDLRKDMGAIIELYNEEKE